MYNNKKILDNRLSLMNRAIKDGTVWTGGKFVCGKMYTPRARKRAHILYCETHFTEKINLYQMISEIGRNKN